MEIEQGKDSIKIKVLRAKMRHMQHVCATFAQVTQMGVFATRSPYRPNPLGLSCVELESVDMDSHDAPVIHVRGADLMDGTPIYDIKPYIKYADSRPQAVCGYVDTLVDRKLRVQFPDVVAAFLKERGILEPLSETLSLDPRPSYHNDPEREYGLSFSGYNVRFKVNDDTLLVISVE